MAANKTQSTDASVEAFLAGVTPARRAEDARVLAALFAEVSGFKPRMWGESIIGYGRYHYRYASGREGDFLATGFSPRKAAHSLYIMPGYQDYSIMPGYQDYSDLLARLGKHKTGKACLYITRLSDVDLDVLRSLIARGLKDLDAIWPVHPA